MHSGKRNYDAVTAQHPCTVRRGISTTFFMGVVFHRKEQGCPTRCTHRNVTRSELSSCGCREPSRVLHPIGRIKDVSSSGWHRISHTQRASVARSATFQPPTKENLTATDFRKTSFFRNLDQSKYILACGHVERTMIMIGHLIKPIPNHTNARYTAYLAAQGRRSVADCSYHDE